MVQLTPRWRDVIVALIAMCLMTGLSVIGVASAFGAFDDAWQLRASFETAGQGLIKGSDVKLRGINVGKVAGVELADGRALVTMDIQRKRTVPVDARAVVRAKTLFGEKFIDLQVAPGTDEGEGGAFFPRDGSAVVPDAQTEGGFELEQVLADAHPLLQGISPANLKVVLSELARSATGMGPVINRQLDNWAELSAVFAANSPQTQAFLADLATIADRLAPASADLVAVGDRLNDALPSLVGHADELDALLRHTARLSLDAADLLRSNTRFIDRLFNGGQASLDLLHAQRGQIIPLVMGLRDYAKALGSVGHVPQGDGTYLAGVKLLLGGELCAVLTCAGVADGGTGPEAPPPPADPTPAPSPVGPAGSGAATAPVPDPVTAVTSGVRGLLDLLVGALGR